MATYDTCLHILGLDHNASLSDIKAAYRRKAKVLHPDVNPSAEAQQQFLRLKKAYEYAIIFKSQKRQFRKKPEPTFTENKKYGTHKDWNSEENKNHRAKARENAQRKKEEYLKSDEYKESLLFSTFFNYSALAIVCLLGFVMIYAPISIERAGWIVSLLSLFVGFSMWWAYVRKQFKTLSIAEFKATFKEIKETHKFWLGVFAITSTFLTFYSTIHTVISSVGLVFLFIIAVMVAKVYCKYFKGFTSIKQNYWAFGIVPFAIHLVFLLNYVVSFDAQTFTTEYQFFPYKGESGAFEDGLIFLEDEKYEDELFLRMFFDMKAKKSSHITYKIENGLLGLDVVKEYRFSGLKNHRY